MVYKYFYILSQFFQLVQILSKKFCKVKLSWPLSSQFIQLWVPWRHFWKKSICLSPDQVWNLVLYNLKASITFRNCFEFIAGVGSGVLWPDVEVPHLHQHDSQRDPQLGVGGGRQDRGGDEDDHWRAWFWRYDTAGVFRLYKVRLWFIEEIVLLTLISFYLVNNRWELFLKSIIWRMRVNIFWSVN